jgi:BirA family biotin operon repressor/biotin-[acetyl-CoA-carboxylase] ligase
MCAVFTGNNIIRLKEVDSTNSYLSQIAAQEKLADGTVVLAEHQMAGKGQRGNVWLAEKGKNLTFSILYYPGTMKINKQFALTQAISLGVYDSLINRCQQVKIKWPNDLYISNKKIGGLLIENSIKGEFIVQTIVGVGLNINQDNFDLPAHKATSLKLEQGQKMDLELELNFLLSNIERRYLQWKNGLHHQLKSQYLEVLYLYQSWHIYQTPNGRYFDGKIVGVEEDGHLLVEDLEQNMHQFGNKEIIF